MEIRGVGFTPTPEFADSLQWEAINRDAVGYMATLSYSHRQHGQEVAISVGG
jgi:hypothetical protein